MSTGVYVFSNIIFDTWLNRKSEEILSKVDRETISNEDMLILILKAQTNHFHHIDHEFRAEFKSIREEFRGECKSIREEFRGECKSIREEFRHDMREMKFYTDKRFDRLTTFLMWQTGLMITLFSGIYLKLFLH